MSLQIKLKNLEKLLQAEISSAKADYESNLILNFSYNNSKYICSLTKKKNLN